MAETSIKKHPIRGAIWGVPMGLGLALLLAGQGIIAFGDTTPFIIVVVIGIVISIVWSMFGPAKAPKEPAPDADAPAELLDSEPPPDPVAPEAEPVPEASPSVFAVADEPTADEPDPTANDQPDPAVEPEKGAEPTEPEDPGSVQI